jgi:hypothetical protein
MGTYTHSVHCVLLEESNTEMKIIFLPLSEASYNSLDCFDARHLSNLAYAHALLRFDPVLNGGSLFDAIGAEAIKQVDKFEAQHVSNTVWAFAKMKKQNHALFHSFGDKLQHGMICSRGLDRISLRGSRM